MRQRQAAGLRSDSWLAEWGLTTRRVIAVIVLVSTTANCTTDQPQPTPSLAAATPLASVVATSATSPSFSAAASPTLSPTPIPSPSARASATASTGTLTGRIGYPSEFIPPLTVYAISVSDPTVWFSVETPHYPLPTNTPPRPTYALAGITPGTYYVLAFRNDIASDQLPGVYSQYVVCGQLPICTDHTLVSVTVRAGEVVSGIGVTDWYYAPSQKYPSRPR